MSAFRPSLSFDEPPPLQACLLAASAEALRFFGARPAAPWRPRRARAGRKAWGLAALALIGAAATAAAMAWPRPSARAPSLSPTPSAVLLHPAVTPSPEDAAARTADAPSAAAPLPPTALDSPPASRAELQIEVGADGHLQLALAGADRAEAAHRLADLTGARLHGHPQALAGTPPVTLHWRGRDAMAAWRALLADAAPHAIDCRAAPACKVWIFGAVAMAAGPRVAATGAALAAGGGGQFDLVPDPAPPQ